MRSLKLAVLVFGVALGACGGSVHQSKRGSDGESEPGGGARGADEPPSAPGPARPSGSGGSSASSGSGGSSGTSPPTTMPPMTMPPARSPSTMQPIQGGLLTAGTWDDNLNFDFYRRYHRRVSDIQLPGLPQPAVSDRMVITVKDQTGRPVAGARVQVTAGQNTLLATVTGGDGRVLFFPGWVGAPQGAALAVSVSSAAGATSAETSAGAAAVDLILPGQAVPVRGVDIALVIDTTGSMGDEIRYLAAELDSIAASVREAFPAVQQRWGMVAYKDVGDVYVTRPVDFTGDVPAFRRTLSQLTAGGGGDYPEAPERALADMNKLAWQSGAVARVAFWIADAPHHAGKEAALVQAIADARDRGIHLYPIAASGTDKLAEFSMRLAAMVSGGRYLFLTDDSGIGGAHMEPTLPCYHVTSLQRAMLRMLLMEVTGTRIAPHSAEVLRTGGDPRDGRCTLADGEMVSAL